MDSEASVILSGACQWRPHFLSASSVPRLQASCFAYIISRGDLHSNPRRWVLVLPHLVEGNWGLGEVKAQQERS